MSMDRSSLPVVFLEKVVLKIRSIFTGEQPNRCVISIKLQSTFPVNLLYFSICAEEILSKSTPSKNCSIEGSFIELNSRRKKWMLCCTYNHHRNFISDHVSDIRKISTNYNHIFLMGDFNAQFYNQFVISKL